MALTYEITFVEDDVLERLEPREDERIASIMFREERPTVTLGRAWHILHALLTGSAKSVSGPQGFILGGGRPLGRDPNGGWVAAYDSGEVAKISAALPSAETLAQRYKEQGLPDRVASADKLAQQGPEYFLEVYRDLVPAMKKAADDELGMLAGLI